MSASDYADINNGRAYPPLTRAAAWRYARKLIRHFGSPADAAMRPHPYLPDEARPAQRRELENQLALLCDGNNTGRRCWAATNPSRGHDIGWGRLIHDVSHLIHSYRHPKARPHDPLHHQVEREVQVYVELQGWLVPRAKASRPTAAQRHEARTAQLLQRLERWQSKARRADTAIHKLKRALRAEARRIERLQAAVAVAQAT